MENEGLKTSDKKNFIIPKRRILIYFIILFVILILVLADQYFIVRRNKVVAPTENDTSVIINQSNELTEKAKNDLDNKDYSSAVDNYNKAIELDPTNSQAYAQKSEAEYASGDKTAAIETVQEGLIQDPDNELLKSKLDVLKKDSFSDPNINNDRE
jgi:tetratricopeptide (TPR) repeat protein